MLYDVFYDGFYSSFIVFQHVSIWHTLLRALWHMTLDSEMNCRPIWGRSRMISPPSLASRGQTHRVWSTWLSWCRNDHEILLVVYHCFSRFLGKHRRCARGLYFRHFSSHQKKTKSRAFWRRTAATMITQILRRNVEKMKVRISNLQWLGGVNSTSVAYVPMVCIACHQVINDLAYKLCWLDWFFAFCGYMFMSLAPPI